MLYDSASGHLRDIDVVEHGNGAWERNNVGNILNDLLDIPELTPEEVCKIHNKDTAGILEHQLENIRPKLVRAAQGQGIPLTHVQLRRQGRPVFGKVTLTSTLGNFSLSRPPEELRALLREMETGYHIPLG